MKIKYLIACFALLVSFNCFADGDNVSFQQADWLPRNLIVGANYNITYTFTNELPFTLTQGIKVETDAAMSNYRGYLQIKVNTCSSALAPGQSCAWSLGFRPTEGYASYIVVKMSYAGSTYILPPNQSVANPAQVVGLFGTGLNEEIFALNAESDFIIAAAESGVYRNVVSSPAGWQKIGDDINSRVLSIAVDNGVVYAGPIYQGIFSHSLTDTTGNWAQFGSGASTFLFTKLLIDSGTLYGTTFQDSVQRNTISSAGIWQQVGSNSVGSSSYALTINGNMIYASSLGVFVNDLTSLGAWQNTDNTFGATVTDLLVVNNVLLSASTAGVKYYDETAGAWLDLGWGFPNDAYALLRLNDNTILAASESAVYANSIDSPGQWQLITASFLPSGPVRALYKTGNNVMIGTNQGVFKLNT